MWRFPIFHFLVVRTSSGRVSSLWSISEDYVPDRFLVSPQNISHLVSEHVSDRPCLSSWSRPSRWSRTVRHRCELLWRRQQTGQIRSLWRPEWWSLLSSLETPDPPADQNQNQNQVLQTAWTKAQHSGGQWCHHLKPLGPVVAGSGPGICLALFVQTGEVRVPGKWLKAPCSEDAGRRDLAVWHQARLHAHRLRATWRWDAGRQCDKGQREARKSTLSTTK